MPKIDGSSSNMSMSLDKSAGICISMSKKPKNQATSTINMQRLQQPSDKAPHSFVSGVGSLSWTSLSSNTRRGSWELVSQGHIYPRRIDEPKTIAADEPRKLLVSLWVSKWLTGDDLWAEFTPCFLDSLVSVFCTGECWPRDDPLHVPTPGMICLKHRLPISNCTGRCGLHWWKRWTASHTSAGRWSHEGRCRDDLRLLSWSDCGL